MRMYDANCIGCLSSLSFSQMRMYDANCCGAKWPFPPIFLLVFCQKFWRDTTQHIYVKVMLGFSGSAWFLF